MSKQSSMVLIHTAHFYNDIQLRFFVRFEEDGTPTLLFATEDFRSIVLDFSEQLAHFERVEQKIGAQELLMRDLSEQLDCKAADEECLSQLLEECKNSSFITDDLLECLIQEITEAVFTVEDYQKKKISAFINR